MNMWRAALAGSVGAAMVWVAATASASTSTTLVDVQFAGQNAQSGAAVIGGTGDVWNLIGQASPGTFQGEQLGTTALVTTTDQASNYSLFYYSPHAYTANLNYFAFAGQPDANLMQGYLYTFSYIYLKVSGLSAYQPYSLYLYTQGDDNTAGRVNNLIVNGVTGTTVNSNANSFIHNDNYTIFSGSASAAGGVAIIDYVTTTEADVNGFQLYTSSVPEPATWTMLALGVGIVGATARRRIPTPA